MAKIGKNTAIKMVDMLHALINEHLDELDEAYRKTEDALSVGVTIKIKPHPQTGNQIDVGINFVESRVKDAITDAVDENQIQMFDVKEGAA